MVLTVPGRTAAAAQELPPGSPVQAEALWFPSEHLSTPLCLLAPVLLSASPALVEDIWQMSPCPPALC